MFHSVMFNGEDAVKKVCRHGDKMSYQDIVDEHFGQKRAELMGARYVILQWSADLKRFPKMLLEKDELSATYKRVSLHAFTTWVHSTLPAEKAL